MRRFAFLMLTALLSLTVVACGELTQEHYRFGREH